MNRLPLHDTLKPLAWLEGAWKTSSTMGMGKFPTIKSFEYCDEISFTSIGQPMFNYVAQSWHPLTKKPMHREVGFLKIIPNTQKVSLVLSHNFGLTTIEEGTITNNGINLESVDISRQTEGVKQPCVTKICRTFSLDGNDLVHVLSMATTTTPDLTEHLRAIYTRL